MKEDFLAGLMASVPLARVLRIFVFDQSAAFTASQMAQRAGISASAAVREMKVLEKLGIIKSTRATEANENVAQQKNGRKKKSEAAWGTNLDFKYLSALSGFVHDVSPAQYDVVIDKLKRTGKLTVIILSGTFLGDATRPVDLLVAADGLSEIRFEDAVKRLEPVFGREIRYAAFSTPEFRYRMTVQDRLIRDTLDFPHTVLLDRSNIL